MKAFHSVAIPHKDILDKKLSLNVYAADLWEVFQGRGPDEYLDSQTFFDKTYMTKGLNNLLDVIGTRIKGDGGDPIIQIQTPFGGGKTHSMIALYHKAQEWDAKRSVIVGTALSPKETLWGTIEKQITGKVERFKGYVSPGKEAIRKLLEAHQPLLILMDEVLEYITKAAGVKVEASNLAAQSMAFLQELTEAVSTLEKTCLAVTLPSSLLEWYDDSAKQAYKQLTKNDSERLYQQLQKVAGRVERIYTPVQDHEIAKIIRQRLFNNIDETEARTIVNKYLNYVENKQILPSGIVPSQYRDRFMDSYPFMPEVIDVLYHQWGTFTTFQRTRGVLRLLAMVVYSLKDSSKPYISLADFDLNDQAIRRELIKHIGGSKYDSVIDADVTGLDSGATKVNDMLGDTYRGQKLGSRTATALFMHSFSGGGERGITPGELKRSAITLDTDSPAIIDTAIMKLKDKLYYLHSLGD